MENYVFILIIVLFTIHEMDAIKTKEWKMFIFLKDIAEHKAYNIFLLAHIPIYLFLYYVILNNWIMTYLVIDVLFIIHTIIHFFFKKHKNNNFNTLLSKIIIYSLGTLSLIHLFILI